jgi:hypothetical protein
MVTVKRILLLPPFLLLILQGCTTVTSTIPARGALAGQIVDTTVDSELAKYYLERYMPGNKTRPEWDEVIDRAHAFQSRGLPSNRQLKDLSQKYSTDFATLILASRILKDPANSLIQGLFTAELLRARTGANIGALDPIIAEGGYTILFAPGWLYKSDPEGGADFSKPRRILNRLGGKTQLLEIEENGTVEQNAAIIAEEILQFSTAHNKIILVSLSKSGPEVALALTMLAEVGRSHSVKAWVNIGGLLRGSMLADEALRWPQSWYIELLALGGRSLDGIESLVTVRSTERFNSFKLPGDILIVNYVGIPLSGHVSSGRTRYGYSYLSKEGPNDGSALIADEIVPGGLTIVELGLDHFFLHPEIDLKTIALAHTVIRFLEQRSSAR